MGLVSMELLVWILAGLVLTVVAASYAVCKRWRKAANDSAVRRLIEMGKAKDFSESLIESSPDGILVGNEDMKVVYVNNAICRLTGRPRDEWIGQTPPFPGTVPEETEELMTQLDDLGTVEMTIERKDGTRFPALVSPGAFETEEGKKVFVVFLKDLTQVKETEEELRESEATFRRIAETSADAIYLINPDGIITYISPAVETILGYTPDEFAGTNFTVHFTEDDVKPAVKTFETNMRGEEVRNVELRIRHKNKEPVFIEVNATPMIKDGKIIGVQGMARDITRRKQTEQILRDAEIKFEAQYRGLPIPIYTWQKQGDDFVLVDFNHAAEEITEGKIRGMTGIKASRFFASDPDIRDELRRTFEERRDSHRDMLYHFKTTGATRYLRVSYGYAPPDLVLVHTEDVTERTVAEQKLRVSEARLRTAVESIPFDFFIIDDEHRIRIQNSVGKRIWGDLRGKRIENAGIDEETAAVWKANNERVLAGEVVEDDVIYRVRGEEREFHTVLSPVYDGGRISGIVGVNIDVSERRRAENALKQSEARLRSIISSTPNVAIEGFDIEGRVLFWNEAAEQIFGWSSDEAVGQTLDQLLLGKEAAREFTETLESVDATGKPSGPAEWSFTRKNGERGTALSTVFAIPFPGAGGKKEFICMDVDITDRKRADEALRESEQKYRFLIENVGTSVTFWDPNGKLLLVNQAGARAMSSTPEALVGRSLHDFVSRDYAEKLLSRHRRVLELDAGAQYEDQIEIKKGKRWYRSILQPVKHPDGKPIGVQVVSHDITDLMEAERELMDRDARLRLMVRQIPAIIWTTDNELRFTSSVGAGLGSLNLRPDEVVGKTLYDYFGTNDPDFMPIAMHRRSLQGEPTSYELKWGQGVWEAQIEPLRDETGEIIGCLAIALDISERKRTEEEIKSSRAQLRRLARRLHEVREEESAAISREIHDELGQALTGFKLNLSWVERRCEPDFGSGDTKEIINKIRRMYVDIDSTIESVRKIAAQLRPRILDDMGLLGAIEWKLQDFENSTGVKCRINQVGLGDGESRLDSPRSTAVYRIFTETITNVGRHAEATRVDVELRSGGGMFMLEVRDDGRGMPRDELKEPKGLGILGMRERAQAFGGDVDIDSDPGKGTSVRVLIPVGKARNK